MSCDCPNVHNGLQTAYFLAFIRQCIDCLTFNFKSKLPDVCGIIDLYKLTGLQDPSIIGPGQPVVPPLPVGNVEYSAMDCPRLFFDYYIPPSQQFS